MAKVWCTMSLLLFNKKKYYSGIFLHIRMTIEQNEDEIDEKGKKIWEL